MQFNIFCNGNAPEGNFRNYLNLLFYSMTDLGHDVVIERRWMPSGFINVIFDPLFAIKHQRKEIEEMIERKIPFGLMDYEIFCDESFNFGTFPLTKDEHEFLKKFIASSSFVWTGGHLNYLNYKKYNEKTVFLRYGYHQNVFEIPPSSKKEIDVFFFGTVRGEDPSALFRQGVLRLLGELGLNVFYQECGASVLSRNSLIRLSKINLEIPHLPPFAHTSPQRIVYLANNAICPIALPAVDEEGYQQYAKVAAIQEIADVCREWVDQKRYLTEGDRVYELIKNDPMNRILEEAFDLIF
ncbi:MAG: hypothetical protein F8N15_05015 [Methanobacterium sp.]|nr:hypothetical protein [Methanobacterium sp.]